MVHSLKRTTAGTIVIAVLLVALVFVASAPFLNSNSVTIVMKVYLYAFGLNSGRTGGFGYFTSVSVDANSIRTILRLTEPTSVGPEGNWKIIPQYQNDPYAHLPSHPTTFSILGTFKSASTIDTFMSHSSPLNSTGPFVATVSMPPQNLSDGNYDLTLQLLVNGTALTGMWKATVTIGQS